MTDRREERLVLYGLLILASLIGLMVALTALLGGGLAGE